MVVIHCPLQPLLIFNHHTLRLRFLTTKPSLRFAEVNVVSLRHKAVHVAAFMTRAQTVPQLFLWADDETSFVVIVKRTETYKLLATLRESDAAAANERRQPIGPLHPLDLCLVDQHRFGKKLSRKKYLPSLLLSTVRV